MIHVITPGRRPEDRYRGTCLHCGCVFHAGEEDVQGVSQGPLEGRHTATAWCPNCRLGNTVLSILADPLPPRRVS